MANKVTGIAISLTSSASSFVKGIGTASKSLTGLSSASVRGQSSLRGLGLIGTTVATGIGSAFGSFIGVMAVRSVDRFIASIRNLANTFIGLFNDQRGVLDRVGKISRELDFSVGSLQKFRLGAALAGTAIIDMEKALQIMTRRIGEAQAGTGEARKAFALLGLTSQELADAGPEKAFLAIQQRLAGMTERTDRAATAFMIFSRQGVNLLNFLTEGVYSFEELDAIVKKTGGDFGGPAVSGNIVKGVEMMNDSFEKLKAAGLFVIQGVIGRIAPLLTYMAESFLSSMLEVAGSTTIADIAVDKMYSLIVLAAEKTFEWAGIVAHWGSTFMQWLSTIVMNIGSLITGLSYVASVFGFIGNILQSILALPTIILEGITVVIGGIQAIGSAFKDMWDLIVGNITFDEFTKSGKKAQEEFAATFADSFNDIKEGYSAIWNSEDILGDKMRDAGAKMSALEKPLRRGAASAERFSEKMKGMAGKPTKAINNLAKASKTFMQGLIDESKSADPFEPIRDSAEKTKQFITDVFKSGELALMITESMATDVSFLQDKDKNSISALRDSLAPEDDETLDDSLDVDTSNVYTDYDDEEATSTSPQVVNKTGNPAIDQALSMLSGAQAPNNSENAEGLVDRLMNKLDQIYTVLKTGVPATVG